MGRKIKIVEKPFMHSIVYDCKVKLDDELVEFRYAQNSDDSIDFYILSINGVQLNNSKEFDEKYSILLSFCDNQLIDIQSKLGDEWDTEEEGYE
jgi:hypothetical protein